MTAPVWAGESLKLGISKAECGTSTPVTDEELTITTTFFNSEAKPATIKSITYTIGNETIGTVTDAIALAASSTQDVEFKYTPTKARVMTVKITAVIEQDGKEYTFTKDVTLDVLDAGKLVYIGIDASHYNEYVAGNYKDSMGNFGELAAGYSVRTVMLKTSEELIAACGNAKFKGLILTAPSRRLADAQTDPRTYSEAELNAIKAFNENGGMVVLAGWSDNYENYRSFRTIRPSSTWLRRRTRLWRPLAPASVSPTMRPMTMFAPQRTASISGDSTSRPTIWTTRFEGRGV